MFISEVDEHRLESLRLHHEDLCQLIDHVDEFFSKPVGVTLLRSVVILCFWLYTSLTLTSGDFNDRIKWTTEQLIISLSILMPSAYLHTLVGVGS